MRRNRDEKWYENCQNIPDVNTDWLHTGNNVKVI